MVARVELWTETIVESQMNNGRTAKCLIVELCRLWADCFTRGDPISGLPTKTEAMALSPDGTGLALSGTALRVDGQSRPRLAIISTGSTRALPPPMGSHCRFTAATAGPVLAAAHGVI